MISLKLSKVFAILFVKFVIFFNQLAHFLIWLSYNEVVDKSNNCVFGVIMLEKINEFKEFVRIHPGLKDEVNAGKSTWQNFYESWYLYGPDDGQWGQYKEKHSTKKSEVVDTKSDLSGPEMMAQAFEYLQKVDIDKVQKTMGTFQQCIQIFQTMQGGKGGGRVAGGVLGNASKPNYSGFFSQFDD